MGVRFRCPNGHRLNVKSFLAGKRGICPKCGARVQIPTCSQDDADSGSPAASAQVDGPTSLAKVATEPPTEVRPDGTARGTGVAAPVAQQVVRPAVFRESEGPAAEVPVAKAAPETSSASPITQRDPVSEAPHAVWYVRPPTGNQYGPASGDVMRGWVAEGRVTAECLVWREGWPDWRRAGTLFANLHKPGFVSTPSEVVPLELAIDTKGRRRSKSTTSNTVAFVVVLAIVSVVLLGALIYVTTVL